MKRNTTLTSLLVTILLLSITSLLMTSCTGVKYSYFNKKKVPYAPAEETKYAQTIPAKPFLSQSENEVKQKVSTERNKKNGKQDIITRDEEPKKASSPAPWEKIFNAKNITKYIPKPYKGTQSDKDSGEMDRDLLIVILIVAIILLIALLGDDLLWLLFVALLVILIYILVKYLGVFN